MPTPIDDEQLKAIVDAEVRSAMGELTGDLSNERAVAMDYYLGENSGRLAQDDPDRSSVVMTTVRDTVEWIMPQLMRVFAQADSVVEFEPVGEEDEEAAKQETVACNHIFWRQNEGFLILYTWFKDALIQKNGIVKWWLDETESRSKEEYDGLTPEKLAELEQDEEVEAIKADASDITSVDGGPLFHVVFERRKNKKTIIVGNMPPEEFIISSDSRSLSINGKDAPRMIGNFGEKTASELREMDFSEEEIDQMMRGSSRWWDDYDQEDQARYHLSDEDPTVSGQQEGHESQRKTHFVEMYMTLDKDGDGYAELLKILRAGDFIHVEEAETRPYAALTPNILSHKFFGLSIAELMEDLQEIGTSTMRNVLDNMYQTNNVRPVINDRVDLDSLLVTRPGAPIYIEDALPVGDAVTFQAPAPLWKEGLTILEYLDTIRKDRTGVGDETEGLDASTLANANTGVMLQAMEAAKAKVDLIARIFAETGLKWLFRGIHEEARKSYDQELRIKLTGRYVPVNPQEWRERDDITVNIGTGSGNKQREVHALTLIGQAQLAMLDKGGLGFTVIPSNLYETAKRLAEALGEKDGDKYFFNPQMRSDPEIMKQLEVQLPQQQGDPNASLVQAQVAIEQGKAQVAREKAQMEGQLKQAELAQKDKEMMQNAQMEDMKLKAQALTAAAKNSTEMEKAAMSAQVDKINATISAVQVQQKAEADAQKAQIEVYRAELAAQTALQTKLMDIAQRDHSAVLAAEGRVSEAAETVSAETGSVQKSLSDIAKALDELREQMERPKEVKRGDDGRPVAIGDRAISYNTDGTIARIG